MRLSLLASACTSAVLTAGLTLPLLAQPAPQVTTLMVMAKGKNHIQMRCKDGKDLKQCIDGLQGLTPQERNRLKAQVKKLQKKMEDSQGKTRACFAMKVYRFPKGFPETGGEAQAKVSDCTSASLAKEKTVLVHVKKFKVVRQH